MPPSDPTTEALLLLALDPGPAGLTGLTARARLLTDRPPSALAHECLLRSAVGHLRREDWIAVLSPGPSPRYELTPLGRERLAWHLRRGTLTRSAA